MGTVIGQGFYELTIDEQSEINGGIAPLVIIGGAIVAGAISGHLVYHDLKNVYSNGYNEIRYK